MTMPKIAYISQAFPNLTMTFVYREVIALRRRGLRIQPISTWQPNRAALSAEAQALVDETYYLFPLQWSRLAAAHLRYLIARPGRYWGALALVTLLNRESLAHRLRSLGHFVYGVAAAAEVERGRADHIHADFALNAATVALVAARLTGRAFSFAAHAHDIYVDPVLLREKIAAAAFITPISEYNRRFLLQVSGNPAAANKMHVVHCGLDPDEFRPVPRTAANARPRLLGIGRLVEKKGFRYLLEACRLLAERGQDFECHIIGGGPEMEALRALRDAYGLGNRVELLGPQPQERVRELLNRADVFALPCVVASDGDRDGIPVVLMEAMALEVPVVSTSLSGIPELIHDGHNGRLVPPGDAVALADAIAGLLADPAFARRLAAQGRLTIAREFDIEQSITQLQTLFAAAIQGQRS